MHLFPHSIIWDDLDLLYFAGYACWNYFNTPFLFVQENFIFKELTPWREGSDTWRRMLVEFPDNIPTHNKFQTFYLDESSLIVRLDYNPDVFTSWARAAHYCYDYRNFFGIWIPVKRLVFPRKGNESRAKGPTLVSITLHELHLQ
jgi:hypothetical protein